MAIPVLAWIFAALGAPVIPFVTMRAMLHEFVHDQVHPQTTGQRQQEDQGPQPFRSDSAFNEGQPCRRHQEDAQNHHPSVGSEKRFGGRDEPIHSVGHPFWCRCPRTRGTLGGRNLHIYGQKDGYLSSTNEFCKAATSR